MDISEILSLVVVGALLSWGLEYITAKYTERASKLITIVASIIIGGLYFWLTELGMIESIAGVLAAASTVYAFIIKEKK